VYDYDRLCPTDDLLGTAEVFFSAEAIETDPATGGEKVRPAQCISIHLQGEEPTTRHFLLSTYWFKRQLTTLDCTSTVAVARLKLLLLLEVQQRTWVAGSVVAASCWVCRVKVGEEANQADPTTMADNVRSATQ
jgi:hypothetical protein